MNRASIALWGAAAMALALPAAAQSNALTLSSVYLGGDLGQARFKNACDINGLPNCDDKDTAWGFFGGFQFNPNIAVELAYHDLGSVSGSGGSIDAKAFEVSAVGSYPLKNQFAAYGKLGAYRSEYKGIGLDNKSTDITWGVGVQYDLSRNAGLRGEWQQYRNFGSNSGPNVDVVRIAGLWRFQ